MFICVCRQDWLIIDRVHGVFHSLSLCGVNEALMLKCDTWKIDSILMTPPWCRITVRFHTCNTCSERWTCDAEAASSMQGVSLNLSSALLWNIKTHHVRMIDRSVRSTVCWCWEGRRSLFPHKEKKPHTFWQKNLKLVELFSHASLSASDSVKSLLLFCSQQLISCILGILLPVIPQLPERVAPVVITTRRRVTYMVSEELSSGFSLHAERCERSPDVLLLSAWTDG